MAVAHSITSNSLSLTSPPLALKLPLGKTTVMHLVARETLPEPNSQGNQPSISLISLQEAVHTLNNVKHSASSRYLSLHMDSVVGTVTGANNWLP